jgi:hypothetical protein
MMSLMGIMVVFSLSYNMLLGQTGLHHRQQRQGHRQAQGRHEVHRVDGEERAQSVIDRMAEPWLAAAAILVAAPLIFTSGTALTMMSLMGIMVVWPNDRSPVWPSSML